MSQAPVRGYENPVYLLQATGGWNQGKARTGCVPVSDGSVTPPEKGDISFLGPLSPRRA